MRKLIILLVGVSLFNVLSAQNLIENPGFENGTGAQPGDLTLQFTNVTGWSNNGCGYTNLTGTPDIVSTQFNPNGMFGIPGCGVYQRNSGQTNNRFAHLIGATGPTQYGESVYASITAPLQSTVEYKVSCYTARIDWASCIGSVNKPQQIEFVLRKTGGGCSVEKVAYTTTYVPILNNCSGTVKTGIWTQLGGTFILSQADVNVGYDKMEIRIKGDGDILNAVFIDDVNLEVNRILSTAAFSFVTPGQTYSTVSTPTGPTPITQICAAASGETTILINGSASANEDRYYISVVEFNPNTWQDAAPVMFGDWFLTTVPTTDINISTLPNVNIQPGKTYMISLAVGPDWSSVGQLFRVNALPTINAGVDQVICNGTSATVNITANNWPVKVYKSGVLTGTYASGPVTLSPTATSTYTFTTTTSAGCSTSDQMTITVNNCSTAAFDFVNVDEVVNESPTPYGPVPVSKICLPTVYINGAASANETSYSLSVHQIQLSNWQVGTQIYSGNFTGQVPSSINLTALAQSQNGSFVVGQVYIVGLSVAPQYNNVNKLFRVISCTKSSGVELQEIEPSSVEEIHFSLALHPNPTTGVFFVNVEGIAAQNVIVLNMLGQIVYAGKISADSGIVEIDLTHLPSGVYTVKVEAAEKSYLEKIVKN